MPHLAYGTETTERRYDDSVKTNIKNITAGAWFQSSELKYAKSFTLLDRGAITWITREGGGREVVVVTSEEQQIIWEEVFEWSFEEDKSSASLKLKS